MSLSAGLVHAVHLSPRHAFSKRSQAWIQLIEDFGVEGDAHAGRTVKHRSRVRQDPAHPNLRQVHLIHAELFAELEGKGFHITPGLIGENITTQGIDLLGLPKNALLHLGADATVKVTGLRNPCSQLDKLRPGLMKALLDHDPQGQLVRKAGIMSVVLRGGMVCPGDGIRVELPSPPFERLDRV